VASHSLLHQELRPLVGTRLATVRSPGPSPLTRRQRQVLSCLLEGDSEKQVALRLELAPHTVHDYVKAVYRHYGVRSRGELLARWIPRR
jgi:DNA-binding NarL/FixJ family response regulator